MPAAADPEGEMPYFVRSGLGAGLKINECGDLAFKAEIRRTENDRRGVWIFSGGSVSEVVRERSPSVIGGAEIRGIFDPLSFAGNRVALRTVISGIGINSANDDCFCIYGSGAPVLVAREGDPAPLGEGVPAANFTDAVRIGLSAAGGELLLL